MSNFDPKLRTALAEIQAVCKKHDIGAHVVLASQTHIEFGLLLEEPTWSIVRFMKNNRLWFPYRPNEAGGHERANSTLGMICGIRDQLADGFMAFDKIAQQLLETLDGKHESRIGTAPDSVPDDDGSI